MILPLPVIIGRGKDAQAGATPEAPATARELPHNLDDRYPPAGSARHLLDTIALLDPRGTPADLFSTEALVSHLSAHLTHTISSTETRALLTGLHQQGLLIVNLGGGDRVVRMSRVLQRGTRRLLTSERRTALASVLAGAIVQRWPTVIADLNLDLLRLLRCATALAENTGTELLRGNANCHLLLRRVGQALDQLGLASAALGYTRALTDQTAEVLGQDNPETLRARSDAASWLGHTGDTRGAVAEYASLAADYDRLLGSEHPETLDACADRASYRARGNEVPQAVAELEAVQSVQVRILGETDIRTLRTRARTTSWRARAGLDAPATTVAKLDDVLNDLWEHHPGQFSESFRTRASIATALVHDRRPTESADVLRELLADQLRLFRTETPATIETRRRLVRACEATGNQRASERARQDLAAQERWVITRYEQLLGASQADVLAMHTSASVPSSGREGPSSEVARLSQLREELMRRNPCGLETLRAWSNLAVAIGRAGDPREAVAELSALRDHAEKVLGDTDPDVLKILSRLAWWQGTAKHRVGAIVTLKTLAARQPEDHPHRLTALYSLAQQHRRNGYPIGSGEALHHLLTVQQRHRLPEDSVTLKARLELVVWRAKNGGTTTVVADLRQAVKAHQDRLGRHHADTLAAEFQLAYWLWETGYPQEARTLLTALHRRQGKYLKPGSRQITETAKTLKRWKTTPPSPRAPRVRPASMNISETATRQVDALLKGLVGREVTSVALLEVLAVATNPELPDEAWQAVATKYCATAIVERTDLDALVAAGNGMITAGLDDDDRIWYGIADLDVARSVLHRAAQLRQL